MSFRVAKPITFPGLRRLGDVSPIPFELSCGCGSSIRGQRENRPQVVACPACGAKRYVFPLSPLPEVHVSLDLPVAQNSRRFGAWLWIMTSAAIAFVAVIGIIALLLNLSASSVPSNRTLSDPERLEKHLRDGKAAIAEGAWHEATRELNSAIQLAERMPTTDRKQLIQQQRQAAILADLLSESPGEIARQSLGLPVHEWRDVFRERYAGRTFILDDTIHRDAAGHYHQDLRIALQAAEVKYDLASVKLLQHLPLNQPRRVLIGVRLADIRKDPASWTILLDADGGVLMTDEEMLSRLSIPIDANLREVLKRQQSWLADLP